MYNVLRMNKNKHDIESTSSVESSEMGAWQATMQDAPAFRNAGGQRERAVVTPLSSLSPEERRAKLMVVREGGGKIVARSAEEEIARTRSIRAAELNTDASDIGTSIAEAQAAAKRGPEPDVEKPADSKEMNATEKELMQAKLDAMYKEMNALEKVLGNEGKSPERIREEKMKHLGHGFLMAGIKMAEIIGGAAAGAAFPALFSMISNML